jgi:hypothetical protein
VEGNDRQQAIGTASILGGPPLLPDQAGAAEHGQGATD